MSFSFSASGKVDDARWHITDQLLRYYSQPAGREARNAAHAVNVEIDHIEASGGTHVCVTASGHGGSWSINVQRDTKAEAAHKAEQRDKEHAAWREQGVSKGFFGDVISGQDHVAGQNVKAGQTVGVEAKSPEPPELDKGKRYG